MQVSAVADFKAAVRVVAQDRNLRSPGASVADPETTPGMSIVTAVADAHVHIHACYAPDELLDNAYANLSRCGAGEHAGANQALFLLITERAQDDYFGGLRALALKHDSPRRCPLRRWRVAPTSEDVSVLARDDQRQLFIIGGRQIACREGLEVLVIGTTRRFRDGAPIRDVLGETDALGVPRVIPWGPGKWFFGRGRLLRELVREFRKPTLFLGDAGGRPGFWRYPAEFAHAARLGVRDLPGTDPLPFPHDVQKVGRMGFRLTLDLEAARPAASLLHALQQGTALERFATLESSPRFVRNQIGMQLRKRHFA